MNKAASIGARAALIAMTCAAPAGAAPYVYPAKGQTAEQQKGDEAACHLWAVEQSGFDPAAPPPPAAAAAPAPVTGSGARLRGAAVGAGVGAISGNAGEGAAVGAVAGGVARRSANRRQAAGQAKAAANQAAAGQAAYGNARTACLTGKGYSVK